MPGGCVESCRWCTDCPGPSGRDRWAACRVATRPSAAGPSPTPPSSPGIDHPTTRRENKSSTTATNSHPSAVQRQVKSATHFRFGAVAVKSRSSRFGAIAWVHRSPVSGGKPRRRGRARSAFARITRSTWCSPTAKPRSRSSRRIRRAPYVRSLDAKLARIAMPSAVSVCARRLSGRVLHA